MSALIKKRRTKTAKEVAKHFGVCERTVRNHFAEPREDYTGRAAERRRTAGEMHAAGKSWTEIAEAVGGTEWAARALVRRYAAGEGEKAPTAANAAAASSTAGPASGASAAA